jgi:hypothetical protein
MIIVDAGGLPASRGTALADKLAGNYGKPLLIIDLRLPDAAARAADWLRTLLETNVCETRLAIGGPRESEAPGIYARAKALIRTLMPDGGDLRMQD